MHHVEDEFMEILSIHSNKTIDECREMELSEMYGYVKEIVTSVGFWKQ